MSYRSDRIFKNEKYVKRIRKHFEALGVVSYLFGVNNNGWITAEIIIDKKTELYEIQEDAFKATIWDIEPLPNNNQCKVTILFEDMETFEKVNIIETEVKA
jgi:hypothetical protein